MLKYCQIVLGCTHNHTKVLKYTSKVGKLNHSDKVIGHGSEKVMFLFSVTSALLYNSETDFNHFQGIHKLGTHNTKRGGNNLFLQYIKFGQNFIEQK